jgi:DNA polymerase (family 10)
LPEPVAYADLRGTLHVHTDWSDGIATLEDMAAAAANLGWEYLGIADQKLIVTFDREWNLSKSLKNAPLQTHRFPV